MSCELNCKEVAEQGKTKVEESLAKKLRLHRITQIWL